MKLFHLLQKPLHLHRPLRFNDLKIKYKLALMIGIVCLIISLFTGFSFQYTVRQYNNLLYSQTANSLSFLSDELTYQLESIEAVSSYITFDSAFQGNLESINTLGFTTLTSQKAKSDITNILNRYYTNEMIAITVVPQRGPQLWWGRTALRESEQSLQSLYQACDEAEGRLVWTSSNKGSGILCARKILKAKNLSLKPLGYLILEIDLDHTVQSLLRTRYTNGQQFQIYISSEDRMIYPSGQSYDNQNFKALSSVRNSYSIQKISGSRMFVTYARLPLETAGWNIYLAVPYDDIFHSLKLLPPLFIASILLAILLAVVLAGHMVKNISLQFNTLVGKMDKIKLEGITHPVDAPPSPANSQDELTVLNTYFDDMVVELKKLIEESYVKELLITQAELKALEQQVNPHFLYNTLNSINWLAKKAGSKEISTIAESLGSLLQNTLNNGQTIIPLETELAIVSCYVKIQQIRFEDLVVTTEIDESALQIRLPKMTIQPLVENAILHSQEEPQDQYLIDVSVKRTNEVVIVRVENSGSNIDVDILEHIRNQSVKPRGNGIGLLNIDSRLRMIFGNGYHLHFENTRNMAVVWFEIPLCGSAEQTDYETSRTS